MGKGLKRRKYRDMDYEQIASHLAQTDYTANARIAIGGFLLGQKVVRNVSDIKFKPFHWDGNDAITSGGRSFSDFISWYDSVNNTR